MPTGIGIAVGGSEFRVPERIREAAKIRFEKEKAKPPPPHIKKK